MQHIVQQKVDTYRDSDAPSCLTTSGQWLVWFLYSCVCWDAASIVVTNIVSWLIERVRSTAVIVGCVRHTPMACAIESVEVASAMI